MDASTSLPDASTSAPGAYFPLRSTVHSFPHPSVLTRARSQPGPCRVLSSCYFLSDEDLWFWTRDRTSRDGLTFVHKFSRLCASQKRVRRWRPKLNSTRATTPSLEARSAQFGRQTLLPTPPLRPRPVRPGSRGVCGPGLRTTSSVAAPSARLVRVEPSFVQPGVMELSRPRSSRVAFMPPRMSSPGRVGKRSSTA